MYMAMQQFKEHTVVDAVFKENLWPRVPTACFPSRRAIHTWLPKIVAQAFIVRLEKNPCLQDQPECVPPSSMKSDFPIWFALDNRCLCILEDSPALLLFRRRQVIIDPTFLQPSPSQRQQNKIIYFCFLLEFQIKSISNIYLIWDRNHSLWDKIKSARPEFRRGIQR